MYLHKHIHLTLKGLIALLGCFLILLSCNPNSEQLLIKYQGSAQGTSYHISILVDEKDEKIGPAITNLLDSIDNSLSTYKENSIISRINRNDSAAPVDSLFVAVFNRSQEISKQTGGAFDMTVGPLVRFWGFGPDAYSQEKDSVEIDSILQYIGYGKVRLEGATVVKEDERMTLDFNAIAQGYSVDLLLEMLQRKGIKNMVVELGGEIRAIGKNASGEPWTVGIDKPMEGEANETRQQGHQAVVHLKDKALATSGNYRKFYEKDGKKIAHTIEPRTGYPVQHSLLSATVVADDCMTADAYATAFMVLGVDGAKGLLSEHTELEAYLVYTDDKGEYQVFVTEGLKKFIK